MIKDYVAFDLETTGLSCDTDEIIEIGALKVKDGKVCDRFMTLIHPKKAIRPEITAITGITNEMTKAAPEAVEVIPKFLEFCGDEVLLGHNIMFDYKFTKTFAGRFGLTFEKCGIDTLKIARKVLPDLPSKSLGALCEYYQVVNAAAHRAYHDALATAKIYQMMAHYFEQSNPKLIEPQPLTFKVKKSQPATMKQKSYLTSLMAYHRIKMDVDVSNLSKSEMSKVIDRIILQYGRMM